jgi:hypothetical protein
MISAAGIKRALQVFQSAAFIPAAIGQKKFEGIPGYELRQRSCFMLQSLPHPAIVIRLGTGS